MRLAPGSRSRHVYRVPLSVEQGGDAPIVGFTLMGRPFHGPLFSLLNEAVSFQILVENGIDALSDALVRLPGGTVRLGQAMAFPGRLCRGSSRGSSVTLTPPARGATTRIKDRHRGARTRRRRPRQSPPKSFAGETKCPSIPRLPSASAPSSGCRPLHRATSADPARALGARGTAFPVRNMPP